MVQVKEEGVEVLKVFIIKPPLLKDTIIIEVGPAMANHTGKVDHRDTKAIGNSQAEATINFGTINTSVTQGNILFSIERLSTPKIPQAHTRVD